MKTQKKTHERTKTQELQQCYENIIFLFARSNEGFTTREVYDRMVRRFKFEKDIKTIENYLKDIKRNVVSGVKLTWVNRGKHQLEDFRDLSVKEVQKHIEKLTSTEVIYGEEKAYMRLAMESIRKLDSLSSKHHEEIEKRLGLRGMEESPYFIDNEDMESVDMFATDILHLKEAITKDSVAEFQYIGKSRKNWYMVEPYKLIIFDGLWYLFGKDCDDKNRPFKTWRLIHIKDVDYERDGSMKHTMKDEDSESILKNADDAQFIVDTSQKEPTVKKDIIVKLKIYPEIAHLFNHKAHIPGEVSKPIPQSDGSLILTTKVNTYHDIRPEIKSWLPHIEILEPKEFREELLMKVDTYRDRFKDEIEKIKEKRRSI